MISNGIDIVKINRIKNIKNIDLFLNKYFTQNEIKYIENIKNNYSSIAGIYAAKEATLKALGLNINTSLKDIEILHEEKKPYINILGKLKETINHNSFFSVSISHEEEYAISSVIYFSKDL